MAVCPTSLRAAFFSGGELFVVQEDGDEQDAFIAEADIKSGPWNISAGDVVKGYSHNIKLRWHQLDGRIPHGVKRFEGTRISVVFFCASLSKVSHRDKKVLSALGFPLPVDLLPHCAVVALGSTVSSVYMQYSPIIYDHD